MIAFNNFRGQIDAYREEIRSAIDRVIDSGIYIGGPEVVSFEGAFAAFVNYGSGVAVANGTDAITLALMACGIGPGSEVIIPAVSAYPTAVGVIRSGATPVYVDVLANGLIDPALAAEAITANTRAVVPVHLYGLAARVDELASMCKARGLELIEDCAQAHGTALGGRPAGSFGVASAWSFYPTKNLGGLGDSGAILASSEDLAERLRRLRNYGQSDRYSHLEPGMNSRLDPIQAAILSVRLLHLAEEIERRREIANRYDEAFAGVPGIETIPVPPESLPSRHLYPVLVADQERRDAFMGWMQKAGVQTLIHYPLPMPEQPATPAAQRERSHCPRASDFCRRVVSLPIHPFLSDADVALIISAVRSWP